MSRFPSSKHLVSWACLCPRSDESAGKHRSTRVRKGAGSAQAHARAGCLVGPRTKDSYERTLFQRIKVRRGPQKAIVAVAASLLSSIFAVIRDDVPYRSIGSAHFSTIDRERKARRLRRQLQQLGYNVTLEVAA